MDVAIRHYIPGRVRLHVPALCRRQLLAEAALDRLCALRGVKTACVNYACPALLVEYEPAHEQPLLSMIGRLRLMSLADLRVLLASAGALAPEVPPPLPRRLGDLSPPLVPTS